MDSERCVLHACPCRRGLHRQEREVGVCVLGAGCWVLGAGGVGVSVSVLCGGVMFAVGCVVLRGVCQSLG